MTTPANYTPRHAEARLRGAMERRSNSRLKSQRAIGDAMREVKEAIEARRKQIYGVA